MLKVARSKNRAPPSSLPPDTRTRPTRSPRPQARPVCVCKCVCALLLAHHVLYECTNVCFRCMRQPVRRSPLPRCAVVEIERLSPPIMQFNQPTSGRPAPTARRNRRGTLRPPASLRTTARKMSQLPPISKRTGSRRPAPTCCRRLRGEPPTARRRRRSTRSPSEACTKRSARATSKARGPRTAPTSPSAQPRTRARSRSSNRR
mmetsp:Transcript_14955/g.44220  ORF Transcript_14955/g.44220 Transcript_14955/m.44220 type:complete len:204 (-) Transcript_14955:348-959(-)